MYRKKGGQIYLSILIKRRGIGHRNIKTEGVAAGFICGGFPEANLTCKSADDKGGHTGRLMAIGPDTALPQASGRPGPRK
ncbi:MAG TPA: hypothetical protein DCL44_08335 [Elusimicrobia bacterium]|nr:hypothetical protein [Elusimicrobiota bacterium]